jgi:F-type H+-transporting ATPase subunit c
LSRARFAVILVVWQVFGVLELIGAGLVVIWLAGFGLGVGLVFAGLTISVARNSTLTKQLFVYAILGSALSGAIALFGLMMGFLILAIIGGD